MPSSSVPPVRGYQDLKVWQVAMELVIEVYAVTRHFPSDERFGLVSQLRRAAVSVATNIAEGHERGSRREYRQFASIARASVAEVETELEIASRLGFVEAVTIAKAVEHADHISRMLTNLRRSLA
jgi:four helix bundle protein